MDLLLFILGIYFFILFLYILYLIKIEIKARFYLSVKKRIIELESKQKK